MVSIKYKKLFSYLNPFQDNLPGKDYNFRIEAINNYLRRGDNFINSDDDPIEKDYKKISYMISNIDNIFVKLSVPTQENDFSQMLVDENDNVLAYVALCYLKQDTVNVDLQGSGKFAKALFGVPSSKDYVFENTAVVVDNSNNTLVDWRVNESLLLESWGDKDFVLNVINNDNIETNKNLIPKELWEDKEFFQGLVKKIGHHNNNNNIFNYLMKEHKYNQFMIEYIFEKHDTLRYFKEHYLKDYKQYKQGNIVHENQALLEQHIVNNKTLMNWMRNLYNNEEIKLCFPINMLQNQDLIVEWYKIKLSGSYTDYNPIFINEYSSPTLQSYVVKQNKTWKLQTFDRLVDEFLKDNRRSNNSLDKFYSVFSHLIMDKNTSSSDFYHLIKDLPYSKQSVYLDSFMNYYKKYDSQLEEVYEALATLDKSTYQKKVVKIDICDELSNLIVEQYPQYFKYLEEKYRTLENLKKHVRNNVSIESEELVKYNDKELNLLMITHGFANKFLESFPTDYILDEDYLIPLIQEKNYTIKQNKAVFKFIEKNNNLIKQCIKVGWHSLVSPKVFENKELSEFLVGTVFSENYKNDTYKFSKDDVVNLVNPVVFSNIDSLKNILAISRGGYLKHTHHLFKQKQFSQMVFSLFDSGLIINKDYLPVDVRLVLDAFKVERNYLDFFNKYDLQNNLTKKLSLKHTKKTTNKI